MLSIPEEQIFTLYEYENLKEDLTYKDILFNIIYDIKLYLGITVKLEDVKLCINQNILDKYLEYLSNFLDPYINKIENILCDSKKLYITYSNKYINNIPNYVTLEHSSKLLDNFLNSVLEVEYINSEYYSFN